MHGATCRAQEVGEEIWKNKDSFVEFKILNMWKGGVSFSVSGQIFAEHPLHARHYVGTRDKEQANTSPASQAHDVIGGSNRSTVSHTTGWPVSNQQLQDS